MPPVTLDDPNNPFAALLQESEALNQRGRASLMDSLGTPQISNEQLLPILIGSALPAALGGLFGGSTGLQAGALGGASGAEFGIKQALADAERKQKLAQLTATQDLDQAKDLRQQAFTGQRDLERERASDEKEAFRATQQEKMALINNAAIADRMMQGFSHSDRLAQERQERFEKSFSKGEITAKNSEQKAIADRWDRKTKPLMEKKNAIQELEQMLAQGTNISTGMIKRAAVKIAEGGGSKVSDKDVEGVVPNTVAGKAVAFSNFLSGATDQTLTPDQVSAFAAYVQAQKALHSKSLGAVKNEFYKTYEKNDTLTDKESLKTYIDELGSSLSFGGVGSVGSSGAVQPLNSNVTSKDSPEYKAYVRALADKMKADMMGGVK